MKRLTLLVLVSITMSLIAFSQDDVGKHGFATRWYFADHQYQLDNVFRWADFTSGIEFEYDYRFNDLLGLAVPLRMYRANLPLDADGTKFKSAVSAALDATLTLNTFKKRRFINPYLYAGLGIVNDDFDKHFHAAAPVGLGFNFYLGQNTFLTTKAGYRFGFADYRSPLEFGVGLMIQLGDNAADTPKFMDTDGDRISDTEDLCPNVAGVVELNGCPDKDGDGVTDNDDKCPDVAGLSKFMGCPDSDGDGVPDDKDACPDERGTGKDGCPEVAIIDTDGDGVEDAKDKCPDVAGLEKFMGCPDTDGDGIMDREDNCPKAAGTKAMNGCPDSDGDAVADKDDKCPNEPGLASNNGCPQLSQEDKATLDLALSAVQFETGSAKLKSSSYAILDKIVDIMKRHPDYKVAIGGHTDSIGSKETNQKLSEKRAKACYDYLVTKGVSKRRMSYKGYGESVPIADNMYKAGREKNRRVEFNLYIE